MLPGATCFPSAFLTHGRSCPVLVIKDQTSIYQMPLCLISQTAHRWLGFSRFRLATMYPTVVSAIDSALYTRRLFLGFAPRLNKRFAFALAAAAILISKVARVYFHLQAIPSRDLFHWGISFFLQDTLALVLLHTLIDGRRIANFAASFFIGFVLFLAFISLTFLAAAGEELQWRNVVLAGDSSSWSLALQALVSGALVLAGLLAAATVTQSICYDLTCTAVNILTWPATVLLNRFRRHTVIQYKPVPGQDVEESAGHGPEGEKSGDTSLPEVSLASRRLKRLRYTIVASALLAQVLATISRPTNKTLVYMSWTLPLVPFVDFSQSASALSSLLAFSANVNGTLDNATALTEPVKFTWLPKTTSLPGFEDWYEEGKDHYSADADPLKISNLNDEIIPELRELGLSNVPIRHVIIIKLESTRKDVFPLKNSSMPYQKLASLHKNNILPEEGRSFLSNLTGTAKFLTGDHNDGFEGNGTAFQPKSRGGINANNAFTASSYTLKSLIGTLCGISPLIANFNVEPGYHIYQPCLPHILNALNSLDHSNDTKSKDHDFTSFKWNSSFMQSVTLRYDKQDKLMRKIGFSENNTIDWWSLKGTPKFGVANISDINYYGMPEVAIEDYIRDAFVLAKENNERVFLSHLTSTTHHGFGIPEDEKTVSLTDDNDWQDLSKYLNAVGYVDRWLQKVLNILDEQGVTNETLVVLTGDHGLSTAERGSITPYNNPHVANFHVPLVFSHPKLPPINIEDAVHSSQILPTILDLLVQTGSLSKLETEAASDLVHNYEGQSLIRPQRKVSEKNGMGLWQISGMNPGGATLAVRDARRPTWRLIVPVYGNNEWRFTDLVEDPHEENPIVSFELESLRKILSENGTSKSLWVEEAAEVSRWWFADNHRRWRCDW